MIELRARAEEKDSGRKIQYFLRGNMQLSYTQFSALKANNGIWVNGRAVHANYILQAGDQILARLEEGGRNKGVIPEQGEINLVYEDDDLIVLDKPAPLACQCTPASPRGTLENRLCAHYGASFVFRPLNRLDKGTSGLMVAARHAHACQLLQKQLHTGRFIREYLAIVDGRLDGEGCIDLPIAKAEGPTVRRVIDPVGGRRCVTHYRVEAVCGTCSLVRLRLETGRTHQIRVHMAAMGHPVTGDFLYGRETDRLPGRFALHSARIQLVQPLTGATLAFHAPLPDALVRLMQ